MARKYQGRGLARQFGDHWIRNRRVLMRVRFMRGASGLSDAGEGCGEAQVAEGGVGVAVGAHEGQVPVVESGVDACEDCVAEVGGKVGVAGAEPGDRVLLRGARQGGGHEGGIAAIALAGGVAASLPGPGGAVVHVGGDGAAVDVAVDAGDSVGASDVTVRAHGVLFGVDLRTEGVAEVGAREGAVARVAADAVGGGAVEGDSACAHAPILH